MQCRVYGVWVCSLLFSVLPHSEKHQQGVTFRDVLLLEVRLTDKTLGGASVGVVLVYDKREFRLRGSYIG